MPQTKKIIYFTAGQGPTPEEAVDIAKLRDATIPAYELAVRVAPLAYAYAPDRFEAADYVAGTLPADADASAFYGAIDTIDPDDIP